jgi:ribosomal protein L12E/L44/L45/RPP1/RPP2
MTTITRKSTPKDKFYRRYAAAYVLGIPTADVPNHSWKQLLPRIYGEEGAEPNAELLEKFRTAKGMLKGLSGANVIEMVTDAQAGAKIAPPKPAPKAKAPARKAKSKGLGAKVKKNAASDADAINNLYGGK